MPLLLRGYAAANTAVESSNGSLVVAEGQGRSVARGSAVVDLLGDGGIEEGDELKRLLQRASSLMAVSAACRTADAAAAVCSVNPFRTAVPFWGTAVPFWGQTSQISSSLSPKRDCGAKGVKRHVPRDHVLTTY